MSVASGPVSFTDSVTLSSMGKAINDPACILVTGVAGFIGSYICEDLANRFPEATIIGVDNLSYAGSMKRVEELRNNTMFTFLQMDVADEGDMALIFKDYHFDLVIHAAAETHVDNSIKDSKPFVHSNVEGTRVLLDAINKMDPLVINRPRFHYVSTDEVYGERDVYLFRETDVPNPRNPYSATKMAGEHLVRSFGSTYRIPWSISRGVNTYGPNQHQEKLIPSAMKAIMAHQPVSIYGDGNQQREWLYVKDHASAIVAIATEYHTQGRIFNIGSGVIRSNNEMMATISRHLMSLGNEESIAIQNIKDRLGHDRLYGVDSTLLKRDLGWTPSYDFDGAMLTTVQHYMGVFGP